MPPRRRIPSRADPPDTAIPPAAPALPDRGWVRATRVLYAGTARAHLPGDLVSAENVARNGWHDGVEALPEPPGPHVAVPAQSAPGDE